MTIIFGVPIQALLGQLLVGLINGSFYAMLSLGLAVIFGLLRIINFAHGALYMLGAFIGYLLLVHLGIGYWPALIIVPLAVGLFGIVELVRSRDPYEPLAPYNGTSDEMAAISRFFREHGLYTFVRWNYFFTNPPLSITDGELREAFGIIDRGLEMTDKAVG